MKGSLHKKPKLNLTLSCHFTLIAKIQLKTLLLYLCKYYHNYLCSGFYRISDCHSMLYRAIECIHNKAVVKTLQIINSSFSSGSRANGNVSVVFSQINNN